MSVRQYANALLQLMFWFFGPKRYGGKELLSLLGRNPSEFSGVFSRFVRGSHALDYSKNYGLSVKFSFQAV